MKFSLVLMETRKDFPRLAEEVNIERFFLQIHVRVHGRLAIRILGRQCIFCKVTNPLCEV